MNRAHIYILNGPPAKVEYSTNGNWVRTKYQPTALGGSQSPSGINESVSAASVTVWIYPIGDRQVHYMFQFQTPNTWALWPSNQEEVRDREQLELGNKNGLYAIEDAAAYRRKLEALKSMK